MYDAYRHPGEGGLGEPRPRLNDLKRQKPGVREILLAAVGSEQAFPGRPKRALPAAPGQRNR